MGYQSIKPLTYSEFQALIREGKVKEVIITRDEIRGELKYPDPPNRYARVFADFDGIVAHRDVFKGLAKERILARCP
jgi:hypothetical protein